jgi:hypothetical protein
LIAPQSDLVDAVAYSAQQGGRRFGERMFDAALAGLKPIQRMPAISSPRLRQLCEIAGLRSRQVTGFPLRWFYFETEEYLDVVCLVGDRQDVAAIY